MYIDEKGNKWFKGNLHTHTTKSDGRKSPEEAMRLYKDEGYDFLAITDHWVLSERGDFEGMLLLSGVELDTQTNGIWHMVGIDCDEMPVAEKDGTAQSFIDAIREKNGIAILPHPAWSLEQPHDIVALTGLTATEIYNGVSESHNCHRAYSGLVLDLSMQLGLSLPYMAADDTHYYTFDLFSGFIYVKAESCTRENIINAIKKGDFYSSQGPKIFDFYVEDGICHLITSPAAHVQFYTNLCWHPAIDYSGQIVTHAEHKLVPRDKFVRAEIIDENGKSAWTSPIILQ